MAPVHEHQKLGPITIDFNDARLIDIGHLGILCRGRILLDRRFPADHHSGLENAHNEKGTNQFM